VSALLSGALLNCSFFAIVRFRARMPASIAPFCDDALLTLGILSVAVAAVFMVRQTDFKRLLAYSSVEHMGLATVLLALSGSCPAQTSRLLLVALLAHIACHSVTKTLLFQTAGNLFLAFRTRAISVVQGLGATMKLQAFLWIAGLVFICGMPPSALFFSELLLVFRASPAVALTVLVLLFIVFAAMMKAGLSMTMGRPLTRPQPLPRRLQVLPALLFGLLAAAGSVLSICLALFLDHQ
jgi:hydrogenase-4 component F